MNSQPYFFRETMKKLCFHIFFKILIYSFCIFFSGAEAKPLFTCFDFPGCDVTSCDAEKF